MATQVTVVTKEGRVIHAVSFRLDPSVPPTPYVPRSELTGGMYHFRGKYGWIDIPASDVRSITLTPGARQ